MAQNNISKTANITDTILPRDAMQARPMSSCGVCLSVRPSVCLCVCHVRGSCQNE